MTYTNAVEGGLRAIYAANPQLKRSIAQDRDISEKIALFAGRDDMVPNKELYQLALYENASHQRTDSISSPGSAAVVAQQREAGAAASAQESANRSTFALICDYWPLSEHEANFRALVEWCNGEISVQKFQMFVETNPATFTLDWSGTRDRLLTEIANELDPNGTRLTQQDLNALFKRRANGENVRIDQMVIGKSRNIDSQISKMAFWTKAQLRARLAELRYRRQVKEKSAADLQADLVAHRQSQSGRFHPYPDIPAAITASVIKEAFNTQAGRDRIRMWNKMYSHAQVEARRLS